MDRRRVRSNYVIGSAFRFTPDWPDNDVADFIPCCRSQSNGAISLEWQKAML
jgi:hypothetical protein